MFEVFVEFFQFFKQFISIMFTPIIPTFSMEVVHQPPMPPLDPHNGLRSGYFNCRQVDIKIEETEQDGAKLITQTQLQRSRRLR